jgi:hypothetical protein
MTPLVLQLEAECLDSKISILEVMRKALVVARKLSLTDTEDWITKELNGYKNGDKAPAYRLVTGQIRAWNPYHGWIPVIVTDSEYADTMSKCFVGQAVGALEDILKQEKGLLEFPFDPKIEQMLMRTQRAPLRPTRLIDRSVLSGILDQVRNMVLEWCLQLEKDGILGEGLIFSAKEKAMAEHSNYTINYNAPVSNSQIQQGSPHAAQTMTAGDADKQAVERFLKMLNENLQELGLDPGSAERMKAEINTVTTQLGSGNPDRSILRESIHTIRNTIEGCAGSLIASGLLFEIGKLFK